MLRILHVTDSSATSGAEWNLLTLERNAPADVENRTAFLFPQAPGLDEFKKVGPTHVIGNGRRSGFPLAVAQLRRIVREHRVDVVHTQLLASTFLGRIASLGKDVGVVTTLQSAFYDGEDFGRFTAVRRPLNRLFDRVTSARNDVMIAVSEYVKRHFVEQIGFDPSRIVVIPNCVEPARLERPSDEAIGRARAEVGLSPGDEAIVLVGRLMTEKGQDDAIRAMPAIAEAAPRAKLVLVGDGPYRAPLEQLVADKGLAGRVIFAGQRRDVPALLRGARLFLFPSRREGLSVALVEAVASGLPAVVCGIPQNREVVEGLTSVRLVPPRSPEAIAREVTALLGDEGAAERARQAAPAIAARFHPRAAAERFYEVCRRAAR